MTGTVNGIRAPRGAAERGFYIATNMPDDWFTLSIPGRLHELAWCLGYVYFPASACAARVIEALLRRARPGNVENGHLVVWPSLTELADASNTSRKNVVHILKRLHREGLLVDRTSITPTDPGSLADRLADRVFIPDANREHVHRPTRRAAVLTRLALPTPKQLYDRLRELDHWPDDDGQTRRGSFGYQPDNLWSVLWRWHRWHANAPNGTTVDRSPIGTTVVGTVPAILAGRLLLVCDDDQAATTYHSEPPIDSDNTDTAEPVDNSEKWLPQVTENGYLRLPLNGSDQHEQGAGTSRERVRASGPGSVGGPAAPAAQHPTPPADRRRPFSEHVRDLSTPPPTPDCLVCARPFGRDTHTPPNLICRDCRGTP